MIEEKLSHSDPLIRAVVHMLTNSLRMVHDAYAPKGRNVADAARDIKEQARHIGTYIDSIAAPQVREEGAPIARKLLEMTGAIVHMIESAPDLDRRTPAMPTDKELGS
jgi:hypothetical protein